MTIERLKELQMWLAEQCLVVPIDKLPVITDLAELVNTEIEWKTCAKFTSEQMCKVSDGLQADS